MDSPTRNEPREPGSPERKFQPLWDSPTEPNSPERALDRSLSPKRAASSIEQKPQPLGDSLSEPSSPQRSFGGDSSSPTRTMVSDSRVDDVDYELMSSLGLSPRRLDLGREKSNDEVKMYNLLTSIQESVQKIKSTTEKALRDEFPQKLDTPVVGTTHPDLGSAKRAHYVVEQGENTVDMIYEQAKQLAQQNANETYIQNVLYTIAEKHAIAKQQAVLFYKNIFNLPGERRESRAHVKVAEGVRDVVSTTTKKAPEGRLSYEECQDILHANAKVEEYVDILDKITDCSSTYHDHIMLNESKRLQKKFDEWTDDVISTFLNQNISEFGSLKNTDFAELAEKCKANVDMIKEIARRVSLGPGIRGIVVEVVEWYEKASAEAQNILDNMERQFTEHENLPYAISSIAAKDYRNYIDLCMQEAKRSVKPVEAEARERRERWDVNQAVQRLGGFRM